MPSLWLPKQPRPPPHLLPFSLSGALTSRQKAERGGRRHSVATGRGRKPLPLGNMTSATVPSAPVPFPKFCSRRPEFGDRTSSLLLRGRFSDFSRSRMSNLLCITNKEASYVDFEVVKGRETSVLSSPATTGTGQKSCGSTSER